MPPSAELIAEKTTAVVTEIGRQIETRERYGWQDFITAQVVAWVCVLATAVSTTWTAFGPPTGNWRLILVCITALPGLMIAIENAFKFSVRHKMNVTAGFQLIVLRSKAQRGDDPFTVEEEYSKYMIDFRAGFPAGLTLPGATHIDGANKLPAPIVPKVDPNKPDPIVTATATKSADLNTKAAAE